MSRDRANVRLEPWGPGDIALLRRLTGDPVMMEHLGGPESEAKIADRQQRYQRPGSGMFKVVDVETGEGVGSVGYWEREWDGEGIYETGWSVVPEHQGRGIAGTATAQVIAHARAHGTRRFVHAFPSVDNAASNGVCRKLGFTLVGEWHGEYPPGHAIRCNNWRLDLHTGDSAERRGR